MVGPSLATLLVKFWAVYGVVEFGVTVLALYLSPFNLAWAAGVLRAAALWGLSWGRRVPLAERVYDGMLVPFYDSQAVEVDKFLAQMRAACDELNEALRLLATQLLNRIAVGGLSGAVAGAGTPAKDEAGATARAPGVRRRVGPPLPEDSGTFASDRQFFAGEASDRAATVSSASMEALRSVIRPAPTEMPKAAYEGSRSLRQSFLRKAKVVRDDR